MKSKQFSGIWATMVTPFDERLRVRYDLLEQIVEWYIRRGADGIFAVCQSSEMEFLSREERRRVSRAVVRAAGGRIPVVASGHVSDTLDGQIKDAEDVYESGADAFILVSNRFAGEGEPDSLFLKNLEGFLKHVDPSLPLGIYECPSPFKWLLTEKAVEYCAKSGRFCFFKDTSCRPDVIRRRLEIARGSPLRIFNANAATFLQSLRDGANGYCGVMANFHPELYRWLFRNHAAQRKLAERVSDFLAVASVCECRMYPDNAKQYMKRWIPKMDICSRKWKNQQLPESVRIETESMEKLAEEYRRLCGIPLQVLKPAE